MTNNNSSKLFWTLPYIIAAIGLLFALIGLSEFYNIKIAGHASAYPFGQINENQWYYQNASIYASYNLTSGLMFLAASLFTILATIKKNKTFIIWGIGLTISFFLAEFISCNVK
ncbi:MAG: hypothetical protein ABIN01_01400 [Ferruginibacter sp.]